MDPVPVSFEQFSADRLRAERDDITREWVETISSRLGLRPIRVLPTDELLDGVPPVLATTADFLLAPDEEKLTAEVVVVDEMKEIAELRRRQGYDLQEVIREFDELAQVLDAAAHRWIDAYGGDPDPKSVLRVAGRLNRAPLLMGEITVGVYREAELESRRTAARQLRDFAETLVHQLKTPLGAAEGAAHLLENQEITSDPAERRRFASLIRRNLGRARTVVGDVHSLALSQMARAKSGRFLPIGEVLGDVLAEVRPLVEESGVSVEVQEPVADLLVDASRVEIVLLNLISNAAKYADPEKQRRWVKIALLRPSESGDWWVEVSDNGLGVPPELHGRIFERFFRAHPNRAEGSGLGLAIVREAIEQMESRLDVESTPGSGTIFRFSVPSSEENEEEE